MFRPLRKGSSLMELESVDEELARDRRTLAKIGGGAAALGVAGAMVLRKGRGGVVAPAKAVKVKKGGGKMPPQRTGAGRSSHGRKKKPTAFEEKRDKLSKARDVAVIAGTGAAGAGALVAGNAARKASKRIGDAAGYASSSISRAAKEVRREVTPERVARAGLKIVKKKAKEKAVEYFPTFTKAVKVLKKRFETPAQRMGVIEFKAGEREQLRNVNTDVFANPLRVAAGDEKAYRPGPGKTKIVQDLPVAHAQVVRSAVREGQKIAKWGGRGSALVKDVSDVVRGKPRAKDASGRKKKREWEKSWAKNAAKTAIATGAVLAHVTAKRKSPGYRAAVNRTVRGAKRKVNDLIPDAFPERGFETPAQRLGVISFASKDRDEARAHGAAGALVGAANGALAGGAAPLVGKQGTEWGKLNARVRAQEAEVADSMAHGGGWKKKKTKGAFGKNSKFGKGERLARAEHEALQRLKKGMRRGAAKGALAGAAVVGAAGYGVGKFIDAGKKRPEKRRFETPARRMGVIALDATAADAGWDVRDPRGRSARVFAPGSRRRTRRPKRWHEEVENERKLWKAGVATAAVGGGAAGLVLAKGLKNGPAGAVAAAAKKLRK